MVLIGQEYLRLGYIDMRENVIQNILENKIIAIVRGANPDQAVLAAGAVFKGGIKMIEVTFNQKNPNSFIDTVNAISSIKEAFPEMVVGAGTVLSKKQVDLAISAGAEYIVSPDTDIEVIKYTVDKGLVSLPGAYTPTEAKKAHDAGADFVKIFPCADINYLKALKAPLSHIKMIAVGGVNTENAAEFIRAGAVGVGVGSSLINNKYLKSGEYNKITEIAKNLLKKVKGV